MDQARNRSRIIKTEAGSSASVQRVESEVAVPLATDASTKYRRGRSLKAVHEERIAIAEELVEQREAKRAQPQAPNKCFCGCGEYTRRPWVRYRQHHRSRHISRVVSLVRAGSLEALDDLARFQMRDRVTADTYMAFFGALYTNLQAERGFFDPKLSDEYFTLALEIAQVEDQFERWARTRYHARDFVKRYVNPEVPELAPVEPLELPYVPTGWIGKRRLAKKWAASESGGPKGNISYNPEDGSSIEKPDSDQDAG